MKSAKRAEKWVPDPKRTLDGWQGQVEALGTCINDLFQRLTGDAPSMDEEERIPALILKLCFIEERMRRLINDMAIGIEDIEKRKTGDVYIAVNRSGQIRERAEQ